MRTTWSGGSLLLTLLGCIRPNNARSALVCVAPAQPDLLVVGSCPIEQRGSDFLVKRRVMICASPLSTVAKGEVRSPVLGRRLPMSRWGPWPPQFSVSLSGFSWPVSRSEPVPLWCSVSCCGRSSPENDRLRWSAAWNTFLRCSILCIPEIPLRAHACREPQYGHRRFVVHK